MLGLNEDSPLEMLRQFAVYFNGDLTENFGAAKLMVDNKMGKGSIRLYELNPGLTAWVYNIKLSNDLVIKMRFSEDRPYYFGYTVSGNQLQKFPFEQEYMTIRQNQNFILISEPNTMTECIIPKEIQFQCCYIIINPQKIEDNNVIIRRKLLDDLHETFHNEPKARPYRYLGNIDVNTGAYTDVIVHNSRTDLVGRLTTEGAVLNMLASQLESHDKDLNEVSFQSTLSKAELSRIAGLGDYVLEHITESPNIQRIANYLALSPKKIQAGIRFLYGCTANEYLTRIRMEHAKELMHSTDDTISEICYKIGLSSRSYFSKLFSQNFGMLPRDYKKSFKENDLLFEISYRSIVHPSITDRDVDNFIALAREMNPKFNITGSLIYHEKVFFQIIEGPREHVLQLYENILADKRHSNIVEMWKGYKVKRDFEEWAMATITEDHELEIGIQGNSKQLDLTKVLGNVDNNYIVSEKLWKRVRNVLKTAGSNAA
ncbi:MAG: BLUF domain-containing protein [Maribacter sp.]